MDLIPVVVKRCSFLPFIMFFLLLLLFNESRHLSAQEAFHALFYSICERASRTTEEYLPFLPLQSKASARLWLRRVWNCCLLVVQTWLLSDLSPFIFPWKCVILEDNLLLGLWTAHQPQTVCTRQTVICPFEKEQPLCNLMQSFHGQTFHKVIHASGSLISIRVLPDKCADHRNITGSQIQVGMDHEY